MDVSKFDHKLEMIGIKIDQGRLEEAISDYDDILQTAGESARVFALRGFAKFELGNFEQAELDFTRAINLKKDAKNTLFMRGRCRQELNLIDDAIDDFKAVIDLDRTDAKALFEIGSILDFRGDKIGARSYYEESLSIDPEANEVRAALGKLNHL